MLPEADAVSLSRADVDLNRLADQFSQQVIHPEEQLYYEPISGQTYRRLAYQNTQSYLYPDDEPPVAWTDPELMRELQRLGPEVQQLRRQLSDLQLDACFARNETRRHQIDQEIELIEARLDEIGHQEYFTAAEE